jgi:hypothetical protein
MILEVVNIGVASHLQNGVYSKLGVAGNFQLKKSG